MRSPPAYSSLPLLACNRIACEIEFIAYFCASLQQPQNVFALRQAAVTFAQSHFGSPSLSTPNPVPCHLPRPLIALAVSMCLAFIKVQTVPNR